MLILFDFDLDEHRLDVGFDDQVVPVSLVEVESIPAGRLVK